MSHPQIQELGQLILFAHRTSLMTPEILSLAIRRLGHLQQWQSAFELLCSAHNERLESTAPHVAAVDVCRTVGRWDMALGWLSDAKTCNLPATNVSNAVSASLLRCRVEAWATMLELLRDRLESGQQGLLLADQISFGTVLAACSRLHYWALAVELVQLMQTSRLTPDVVPLCSAAAACNRAAASSISGAWRWSLYFFSLARWAGQTPNLTLHNCAISAVSQVSKHGNWALAMQKLQAGGGQFLKPMARNGNDIFPKTMYAIDGGVWRPQWPEASVYNFIFLQFKSWSLQTWNLPLDWVLAFLGSSSGP